MKINIKKLYLQQIYFPQRKLNKICEKVGIINLKMRGEIIKAGKSKV